MFAALLQYVNILSVHVYIIHCFNVDMYVCLILEPARERHRYCLVIPNHNNPQSPSQQNTFSKTIGAFECHRIFVSLEIAALSRAPHQVSKEIKASKLDPGRCCIKFCYLPQKWQFGRTANVGNLLCPLNKVGEVSLPKGIHIMKHLSMGITK